MIKMNNTLVSVFPCLSIFGLKPVVFFLWGMRKQGRCHEIFVAFSIIANLLFFQTVCVFVPKLRAKDSNFVGVFLVPLSCSWSWSHS